MGSTMYNLQLNSLIPLFNALKLLVTRREAYKLLGVGLLVVTT